MLLVTGIVLCYIIAFREIGYSNNNVLAITMLAFSIAITCTGMFYTGIFQPPVFVFAVIFHTGIASLLSSGFLAMTIFITCVFNGGIARAECGACLTVQPLLH